MAEEYYEENKTLKEKVDLLMKDKEDKGKKVYKEKKFRIPFGSKVGKGAMI